MSVLKANHGSHVPAIFYSVRKTGCASGVLQTCQGILFMNPVGIVCYLRKYQLVPRSEVLLTLKNEIMRSCITENTK